MPVQMHAHTNAKDPFRVALKLTKMSSPVTDAIKIVMIPTETSCFQPFSFTKPLMHRVRHTPTCRKKEDSLLSFAITSLLTLSELP